jgi:vacuolar protein sorting-associated protein 13A/C
VSTDGNWVEAFIQDSLQGVHKVRQLLHDTDTGSLDKGPEDRAGTINALKQMVSQPKFGKC